MAAPSAPHPFYRQEINEHSTAINGTVKALASLPGGLLASGSLDMTVRVSDVGSGRLSLALQRWDLPWVDGRIHVTGRTVGPGRGKVREGSELSATEASCSWMHHTFS